MKDSLVSICLPLFGGMVKVSHTFHLSYLLTFFLVIRLNNTGLFCCLFKDEVQLYWTISLLFILVFISHTELLTGAWLLRQRTVSSQLAMLRPTSLLAMFTSPYAKLSWKASVQATPTALPVRWWPQMMGISMFIALETFKTPMSFK